MERILLERYGVALGSCVEKAPDLHPELEPTVSYHTDTDTLREEMKTLQGWQEHGELDETEEEERFGI